MKLSRLLTALALVIAITPALATAMEPEDDYPAEVPSRDQLKDQPGQQSEEFPQKEAAPDFTDEYPAEFLLNQN